MPGNDKFTIERITSIHAWTEKLFSFQITCHLGYRFIPGQFARLGVRKDGRVAWRAYSIVSANYDPHLEFYSIVVPAGEFTSTLATLNVGDEILVDETSYGALTTDRFECGKDLWLLSTGTGLAPFISILLDPATWEQYQNIVLVHSVRTPDELAYREFIEALPKHEYFGEHAHKLRYVQVVTRAPFPNTLDQRITELLNNRELELKIGLEIDSERSRIMICGNPDMVDDTRKVLLDRGLTMSHRGQAGHLAVENYW
jgi:ferredoxin--NADP+ reductase